MRRGGAILTPNELVFPVGVLMYCISVPILVIIIGLMSRATFAIGRDFLSAMDDREWPQERRASSLT